MERQLTPRTAPAKAGQARVAVLLKSTDEAAHKFLGRDGLVGEDETVFDAGGGFGEFGAGIVENCNESFSGGDAIADSFVKFLCDCRLAGGVGNRR